MRKLDWDAPFGIICGPAPVFGARYEQNGRYYDHSGNLVKSGAPEKVDTPDPLPNLDEMKPFELCQLGRNRFGIQNLYVQMGRERLLAQIKEVAEDRGVPIAG